ncbi:NADH-quinone oxidoreductase subunit J [soil metagenome]
MTLNAFYFLSFLTVLSALLVVFSKNPVYSALYLVITLASLTGHYILLNAQFLAFVNLIVYAGAIMVLFLFVIMFLNLNTDTEPHKSTILKFTATICAGLLLIVLIASLKGAEQMAKQSGPNRDMGSVKNLGKVLFTDFLLPFEIASVLLLVAMIGSVMLGKPDEPLIKKP